MSASSDSAEEMRLYVRSRWLASEIYSFGIETSTPRFIETLVSSAISSPRISAIVRSSIFV